MWNSYRKNKVLAGHELLRVTRPDIKSIENIRRIVWSLTIMSQITFVLFDSAHFLTHPVFNFLLMYLIVSLVFIIMHVGINTHPIIFSKEGIFQKWNRAVLWNDIEGYIWMPIWKNYLILRLFPSNTMPMLSQINSIKGGFGMIHSDSKKSINELLSSKGIKYEGN